MKDLLSLSHLLGKMLIRDLADSDIWRHLLPHHRFSLVGSQPQSLYHCHIFIRAVSSASLQIDVAISFKTACPYLSHLHCVVTQKRVIFILKTGLLWQVIFSLARRIVFHASTYKIIKCKSLRNQ